MLRGWSIVPFLVCAHAAHAVRLPKKPERPPNCELSLGAGKLVIGNVPAESEALAKRATFEAAWADPSDVVRHDRGQVVRTALELADGSAMFLVDVRVEYGPGEVRSSTFAVRIDPEAPPEVTPYEPAPLVTAEVSPAQMIRHEALTAAAEDFPVGQALPGVWAGGGAPKISYLVSGLVIVTGHDRGVALVALVGESVAFKNPTMYAVAEIRDGALYSLTDPLDQRVEPISAPPLTERAEYEAKAKKAALDHLVAHHEPRVDTTSAQMRVTQAIDIDPGYVIGVEISHLDAGIAGIRQTARYLVQVTPDGETIAEPEREVATPAPVPLAKKPFLLGEDEAIRAVTRWIGEREPTMNVRSFSATLYHDGEDFYSVTAKVDKGAIGLRSTFFHVRIDERGQPIVTMQGAQG